jgi:hypothetical protein
MATSKADSLLNQAIRNAGLKPKDQPAVLYASQEKIRRELEAIHRVTPIAVSTTGTITERVCEWGLKATIPDGYSRLKRNEKWMGDFSLLGYPFNALLTVKSFKAKERLLASGLGIGLAPTIAFGWFDDPSEFREARCRSYRDKGFAVIYMPASTLQAVDAKARSFLNSNQKPLLRDVLRMPSDLAGTRVSVKFGRKTLPAVCAGKL